jgi:toxin ParE1/3/4
MIVRFTQAAETDLEQIADYIGAVNPERALRFFTELRVACEGLSDMPERFQLVPRDEPSLIRRRVHGDYFIFYRLTPEAVDVLHILHGAMDYERLLFPD